MNRISRVIWEYQDEINGIPGGGDWGMEWGVYWFDEENGGGDSHGRSFININWSRGWGFGKIRVGLFINCLFFWDKIKLIFVKFLKK